MRPTWNDIQYRLMLSRLPSHSQTPLLSNTTPFTQPVSIGALMELL